jgi:hypothetical protein
MQNSAQESSAAATRRPTEYRDRGPRSWSPLQPGSSYDPEEDRYWLERELTLLERAVEDRGEMRRSELGDLVGCKYWVPGRFARALKAAVEQGRIKHTRIGRYGPADG